MDKSSRRACSCICITVVYIIAVVLVASSFSVLAPNEMGIAQNTVAKGIDDSKVYTGGRYFLGLGRSFIVFPTEKRNIYFGSSPASFGDPDASPITLRVPQGAVTLEVSLQYSLQPSSLIDVYRNFQLDFHRRFVTVASSTIQLALQQLALTDFFTNRTDVQAMASSALADAFAAQHAAFHEFQLRKVTLPASNENQIVQKIQAEVRQRTAAIVQDQQTVDAQTTVIVGRIDQEITVYVANKTNEAAIVLNDAFASAKAVRLSSESTAYGAFIEQMGFNSSQLLRYLYYRQLWSAAPGSVKIAAGFDKITGII